MNKRLYAAISSSVIVIFAFTLSACQTQSNASQLSAQARCETLTALTLPGSDMSIDSARYVSSADQLSPANRLSEAQKANFAPFCQLTGQVEKRVGANDQAYAIGFGLSLPDDWNGKFLFQGGGGLNGLVRDPIGALAAGDIPAVFRGFAVASTDSGHQSDTVFDTRFFADQQAMLNFYWRAVAKTTAIAEQLIPMLYQQDAQTSYFVGCSTGGREAMSMSQRFPNLYDGIIAGAPARTTNLSEIADLWSANRLRQAAKPGEPVFSAQQQDYIVDSLLEKCDALDGQNDGLIFATAQCDFNPKALQCSADNHNAMCLSPTQSDALADAFAGPKDSDGNNVYPGFYFDSGIRDGREHGLPGLLQAVAGPLGRARQDLPFDIQREMAIAKDFPLAAGNAVLTNLSTFAQQGNKIMFFHGASDPWFSAKDTLNYFNAMQAHNGGAETASEWSQFYFVPGMGHCGGGDHTLDSFDMLSALTDWVENDKTPQQVVASGTSMPGISRPLCPYPTVTTYVDGDPALASSYQCR